MITLFVKLVINLILLLREINSKGMVGFYDSSCPQAEEITAKIVTDALSVAPTLSGPLLRLFFHDCFVRGCDASVLLNSPTQQAEKDAVPNKSLRGFDIIDKVKTALEKKCPGIVSCADIVALVARDVVVKTGGSTWNVETGRRDGNISLLSDAIPNLPSPFADIGTLKTSFKSKGLSVKDLAVLSGAHTLGTGHCAAFKNRLYNFTGKGNSDFDPTMDSNYVNALRKKCTINGTDNLVQMDPGSSIVFDEKYYLQVSKKRGLFQSDAALLDDSETKTYVNDHKSGNADSFFQDFAVSMVNMGRIEVLTGTAGQIRKVCSRVN
ncbi:peroxidase 27-like [Silene latifolia]|uniref:peroxidase 27-like n=1 Tax=Silene latifolia TaxID=37657 RepID=UPI003D77840D